MYLHMYKHINKQSEQIKIPFNNQMCIIKMILSNTFKHQKL